MTAKHHRWQDLPIDRPNLPTVTASLQLVEALGSHSMAYFKIDALIVRAGELADEAAEEAEEDAEGVTASRPNLVATLPAA